jgi:hypothetical protein
MTALQARLPPFYQLPAIPGAMRLYALLAVQPERRQAGPCAWEMRDMRDMRLRDMRGRRLVDWWAGARTSVSDAATPY